MRILLAEDEAPLARAVGKILEKNNYSVDIVYNGEDAVSYLEMGNYDCAILDVMMPRLDGISALRKVRTLGIEIPILILSAKSEVEDKIAGLDCGANDYLTKPFDSRELLARLRALTRQKISHDTTVAFGNLTLDRASYTLSAPGGSYRLAGKEYQIMEMLISNPGTLISSERFMEKIWGYDSNAEINVVWVYISYLRKKLTVLKSDVEIKVKRNIGYTLEKVK